MIKNIVKLFYNEKQWIIKLQKKLINVINFFKQKTAYEMPK